MIGTALEPIYLDVDLSYEAYELTVEDGEAYDVDLDTVIKVEYITGDMYDGPYDVTPRIESVILATRNKTMRDDVTVYDAVFYTGTINRGSYVYDTIPDDQIVPLGNVPARYYSEIVHQLTRATASGTRNNENWRAEKDK